MKLYGCLGFFLTCTLSGCSSAPVKPLTVPMCSGKMPTQKYIWTISFYQGIPKGMELARVSDFAKNRSELQDHVADSAVGAFVYLSSNNGRYARLTSQTNNNALQNYAGYLAEERSAALIETGASNFLFCAWDNCAGLQDPVTGAVIKSADDNGRYSNTRLRKMYYVEGIVDPDDFKHDSHRQSSYSSPSPAYVNWTEYFERHPFSPGAFFLENYFSVPDSAKKTLCDKAGFETDCFAVPKYDRQNHFIPPAQCNINDMKCNGKFSLQAPFRYAFLMANNGMCGNSCMDDINAMLRKLRDDPFFKRRWEDAIAKDIFLKLSTSKTRKVEKDWITTRIEFNPSLFCQYARPNSELLSQ